MNDSNEDEENYYYTSGFESEYTETDPSSKNYETPIENPNIRKWEEYNNLSPKRSTLENSVAFNLTEGGSFNYSPSPLKERGTNYVMDKNYTTLKHKLKMRKYPPIKHFKFALTTNMNEEIRKHLEEKTLAIKERIQGSDKSVIRRQNILDHIESRKKITNHLFHKAMTNYRVVAAKKNMNDYIYGYAKLPK